MLNRADHVLNVAPSAGMLCGKYIRLYAAAICNVYSLVYTMEFDPCYATTRRNIAGLKDNPAYFDPAIVGGTDSAFQVLFDSSF